MDFLPPFQGLNFVGVFVTPGSLCSPGAIDCRVSSPLSLEPGQPQQPETDKAQMPIPYISQTPETFNRPVFHPVKLRAVTFSTA